MRIPLASITLVSFIITSLIGPMPQARADDFLLPTPGVMVHLSPPLNPPMLKGIKVHPDNPFRFDFILDKGDSVIASEAKQSQQEQLKQESTKLIKYFLASLTIPEKDLWVNLSPYEKDRIIPQSFGLTEMGRDLLAEDYMLKQITASLIYPEDQIGKNFWKRIYEESAKKFGTTNIPVNTFNKVWIVPEKAVVYENAKAGTAYVVESKLKVMLEQDYLALEKNTVILSEAKDLKAPLDSSATPQNDVSTLGSQIVREIVIPELTKEVNEDKNFSQLRQVYNSLILATWYKKKIKDSILEQVYANKNKVAGVNIDPQDKEKIYSQYLRAFKKGVFNYIKEEAIDIPGMPSKEQGILPRKYFSGGFNFSQLSINPAMRSATHQEAEEAIDAAAIAGNTVEIEARVDQAMNVEEREIDANAKLFFEYAKSREISEQKERMLNAARANQAVDVQPRVQEIFSRVQEFIRNSYFWGNLTNYTSDRLKDTEIIVADDVPTYASVYHNESHPIVIINAELVRKGTDAQIAFVLGHELGHLLLRHVNDVIENETNVALSNELSYEIEKRADVVGIVTAIHLMGLEQAGSIADIFDEMRGISNQVAWSRKKWGMDFYEGMFDPHMPDKQRKVYLDMLQSIFEHAIDSTDKIRFLKDNFNAPWPENMGEAIHEALLAPRYSKGTMMKTHLEASLRINRSIMEQVYKTQLATTAGGDRAMQTMDRRSFVFGLFSLGVMAAGTDLVAQSPGPLSMQKVISMEEANLELENLKIKIDSLLKDKKANEEEIEKQMTILLQKNFVDGMAYFEILIRGEDETHEYNFSGLQSVEGFEGQLVNAITVSMRNPSDAKAKTLSMEVFNFLVRTNYFVNQNIINALIKSLASAIDRNDVVGIDRMLNILITQVDVVNIEDQAFSKQDKMIIRKGLVVIANDVFKKIQDAFNFISLGSKQMAYIQQRIEKKLKFGSTSGGTLANADFGFGLSQGSLAEMKSAMVHEIWHDISFEKGLRYNTLDEQMVHEFISELSEFAYDERFQGTQAHTPFNIASGDIKNMHPNHAWGYYEIEEIRQVLQGSGKNWSDVLAAAFDAAIPYKDSLGGVVYRNTEDIIVSIFSSLGYQPDQVKFRLMGDRNKIKVFYVKEPSSSTDRAMNAYGIESNLSSMNLQILNMDGEDKVHDARIRSLLEKLHAQFVSDVGDKEKVIDALFGDGKEETTSRLIELASLLRNNFKYDISNGDLRSPLRYAIEEKIFFKIGHNLYISPITESFRRHFIFKTDEQGHILFALEFMIPGDSRGRGLFSVDKTTMDAEKRKEVADDINSIFPGEYSVSIPYVKSLAYDGGLLYGKFSMPQVEIVIYDYSLDGKRLTHLTRAMKKQWAKNLGVSLRTLEIKITEEFMECAIAPKTLGYLGNADAHRENMRINTDARRLEDIKVQLVGDFEDFSKNKRFTYKFFMAVGILGSLESGVGMYQSIQHLNMERFSVGALLLVASSAVYLVGLHQDFSTYFFEPKPSSRGLLWDTNLSLGTLKDLFFKAQETVYKKMGTEVPVSSWRKFYNNENSGIRIPSSMSSTDSNKTMVGQQVEGGIDLTPDNMNIQVKTGSPTSTFEDDSGGIKFHLTSAMLAQLQNAPGFVPIIISIQPMVNLRKFLMVS